MIQNRNIGKLSVMLVAMMIVATVFAVFVPTPFSPVFNVKADTTTFYADDDLDGWLDKSGAAYPPWSVTIPDNTSTDFYVGQDKVGDYYIDRAFLSFNTSLIPDDANILSVTLRLRLSWDGSGTNFDVKVYSTYYPGWNAVYPNWNATGSFQGILFNTAGIAVGNWYPMALSNAVANKTGNSQFMLNSSRDPTTIPVGAEWVWLAAIMM